MSHVALMNDDTLIRVGKHARSEAERTLKRYGAPRSLVWSALLAAVTDEWLARHPRPQLR